MASLRLFALTVLGTVLLCCAKSPGASRVGEPRPTEAADASNASPDSRLAGLALPGAVNALDSPGLDGPVVVAAGGNVLVDGVVVGDTHAIESEGRLMRIDGLFNALKARRESWKREHTPADSFPGIVWLGFDGSATADVVKSVFQTAAFAGFPNESLLVMKDGALASFDVDAQIPGPPDHPPSPPPSSARRMREGATSVNGRLPPEVIQRIVRQNFGRFRVCYERGLARRSDLKGEVRTRFTIATDGSVGDVKDAGSNLPDPDVVQCVLTGFGKLSFPQPEGGIVTVVYPIQFTPGE